MNGNADLRIRIAGPKDKDSVYRIEAQSDDGSFYTDQMQVGEPEEGALLACASDNRAYGERLAHLLFTPQLMGAFQQARGRAGVGGRVRIRLWISSDASELHAFAWERLFLPDSGNPISLACCPTTPFSRYTGLGRPEGRALAQRGEALRLLVAISNPTGLPEGFAPIDVREELRSLSHVLRQIDDIEVTLLPGRTSGSANEFADYAAACEEWKDLGFTVLDGATTPDMLRRSLAHQDAIHLLAHGAYVRKTGSSVLFLEDDDGSAKIAPDTQIVEMLTQLDPLPPLLVLDSCESARHPDGDAHAFVSLGPKLVEAGFPSVIAMQQRVPMELSHQLRLEFYRDLLDHGAIDLALNQSRSLLYSTGNADWSIPVLFMRVPNGQLFAPDPVRFALHATAEAAAFADVPLASEIPLEAIALAEPQLEIRRTREDGTEEVLAQRVPPDWKRIVSRSLFRADLWSELVALAEDSGPPRRLAVIVSDRGARKTALLKRLVRTTAQESLRIGAVRAILPVYVDLDAYPQTRSATMGRIPALVLAGLQPFWPVPLTDTAFRELMSGSRPQLCVIFNHGDDLSEQQRADILTEIDALIDQFPNHKYLLAGERDCWNLEKIRVSSLLAVQPFTRHKLERFLRTRPGELGKATRALADRLAQEQMFDLAAVPWLLMRMASQAQQCMLPTSRAQVLSSLLASEIVRIPPERGQQARAMQSLFALAREMQMSYRNALPAAEAFAILAQVRGNREYNLEELLDRLDDRHMLQQLPDGSVRFPYPCVQAYCCARSLADGDNAMLWSQVAAGLGQPKRVQWWSEALILLCGLLPRPIPLLERMAYGSCLLEGEHLFLAARCLQETRLGAQAGPLADQIFDALVWRTDSVNEPCPPQRVRAVVALGQLARPEVVPHLVRLARERVRTVENAPVFEFGSVRQAAFRALRRLPQFDRETKLVDPDLASVISCWHAEDVARLDELLYAQGDAGSLSGMAAFALADLQYLPEAVSGLTKAFLSPTLDLSTRWSVADALLSLDPQDVIDGVVRPFVETGGSGLPVGIVNCRAEWNELVLYLIGHLRTPLGAALDFTQAFLADAQVSAGLKGRAILALGLLNAQEWRTKFVDVALGEFGSIHAAGASEQDSLHLRRKALEALAEIGDAQCLAELRRRRSTQPLWPRDIQRAFYDCAEEISWREYELDRSEN